MMSSGKRKREEFSNKYNNGGYIPQQDGAGDSMPETLEVEMCFFLLFDDRSCCLELSKFMSASQLLYENFICIF